MVEFADRLTDLIRDHKCWSETVFGSDKLRGPMAPLKHLEKEAVECQQAVGTDHLREELADVFLLWLDACRRASYSIMDMVKAAEEKMVKNKQRTWPEAPLDEPVMHVKLSDKIAKALSLMGFECVTVENHCQRFTHPTESCFYHLFGSGHLYGHYGTEVKDLTSTPFYKVLLRLAESDTRPETEAEWFMPNGWFGTVGGE